MTTKTEHIGREELSAYVDGDLEDARTLEIERHLGGCPQCRQETEALRSLAGGLSALADVTPPKELWAAIEDKLAARPAEPRLSWWRRFWMVPVAAAVGAAAALLVVFLVGGGRVQEASLRPMEALAAVQQAELDYRKAISKLEGALGESQPDWSPEVRKVITEGLASINQTIEKCRTALHQDPADPEAQESMLAAYQAKVDFLTERVADSMGSK